MTISNFKTFVEGWLNRTSGSFTVGGFDYLLQAMNDARRAAQRAHVFELLRTEDAYLTTSAAGALWTTGCKTTPGGATAILMRRIDEIWQYAPGTIDGSTVYLRTARIMFNTSGDLKRELPVVDSRFPLIANQQTLWVQNLMGYAVGPKLFVTGTSTTSATYKLVGVQWLDDLTGAETPDIFLTYFTDWFRMATVMALNTYLKDDERFAIDTTLLSAAWQSVKTFDGQVANMGEQANLN